LIIFNGFLFFEKILTRLDAKCMLHASPFRQQVALGMSANKMGKSVQAFMMLIVFP